MTPLIVIVVTVLGVALIASPFYFEDRRAKRSAEARKWADPEPQSVQLAPSRTIRAGRPEVYPVTEQHHPTLATPQAEPELYYLLTDNGANTGVFAEFTTRFIDKLIGPVGSEPMLEGDEELVPFFIKPNGDLIDRPRLETHVTHALIAVTGGPKTYPLGALEIAHRPGKDGRAPTIPITNYAFDKFMGHAVKTLQEMGVSAELIQRLGDKLAPMRLVVVQA
jgi:truncated hemoglobin YjbI